MIYIVQRWYISEFEEYVDTVLVTTNQDKAFMVCKEMQKLYPNDDIDIAEANPKSFDEMSKEEKIKFVNKQIDSLLDFIETNKQAKYNKYKKEFCK